jgi:hypothetical protein
MATTTNYSWSTPDDTALVKDGASAIRTLGSSADTTVKALNPGTTAGDIDYYTTSTTKARVGIGTAGQVLAVNSGATAPEWITSSSGGMTLISTTTLTGASVSLTSIPGTYIHLELIIQNFLPATDNAFLRMRFNSDTNARYNYDFANAAGATNQTFVSYNHIKIIPGSDDSVAQGIAVTTILDYASTTRFKVGNNNGYSNNATDSTRYNMIQGPWAYSQTAAITSIDLSPDSGNFTSGTALLYGVK